jgi:hypothetical protein
MDMDLGRWLRNRRNGDTLLGSWYGLGLLVERTGDDLSFGTGLTEVDRLGEGSLRGLYFPLLKQAAGQMRVGGVVLEQVVTVDDNPGG